MFCPQVAASHPPSSPCGRRHRRAASAPCRDTRSRALGRRRPEPHTPLWSSSKQQAAFPGGKPMCLRSGNGKVSSVASGKRSVLGSAGPTRLGAEGRVPLQAPGAGCCAASRGGGAVPGQTGSSCCCLVPSLAVPLQKDGQFTIHGNSAPRGLLRRRFHLPACSRAQCNTAKPSSWHAQSDPLAEVKGG